MGQVVDFEGWLERRAGSTADPNSSPEVQRLERAVQRLHALVSRALDSSGRVQTKVETELLAIMGELTVGLVGEAAQRAERLADRLASAKRAAKM
jgi:hypothetical protein